MVTTPMRAMPHEFSDTDFSVRFFYQGDPMSAEYMTIEEAASFLGVSDITVKRYIREKLIQSEKQSGSVVLLREAVERYKRINEQFSKR